jgi:hypothetical protein
LPTAPEQRRSDAPTERDRDIAAIHDRDEHPPSVPLPFDAKVAQRELQQDAPGHAQLDADAQPYLHVHATGAQRARGQQDEGTVVAWFRTRWSPYAECHYRALAGAERKASGHDPKPRPRRDVDHDPLGAFVSNPDPSRAGHRECELRRRDRERDPRPGGARPLCGRGGRRHEHGEARESQRGSHRAAAVKVTVAV